MNRFLSRKAQSLIEYSLILAIVGVALIGMQLYMKRGLQGVVKIAADQLGPQQGAQVMINFRRQTNAVSLTHDSKLGSTEKQVSAGGAQTKRTDATSTSSGSSASVSQQ